MDPRMLEATPPWDWPRDAAETILKALQDKQAEEKDRSLAAELAGDSVVVNDELCEALLSVVDANDEPDELRARAAIAFGPALEEADMDDFEEDGFSPISKQTFEKIQTTLHRTFSVESVPTEVRRRVLEGSVRAPQDWHADAIRDSFSSDEKDWKLTAVFCMRYIRGFDKLILESLDESDPEICYEAVCAAGNWQVRGAWRHITALLKSKKTEKNLLLAAIEAASFIRPKEARLVLGDFLHSRDEDIKEAAFDAISMAEGPLDEDEGDEENELL
jgi:hypothetical protein